MPGTWLREEQADLAVDKILEAASRAFIDLGVARTRMGHIAKYAGCSRGTLYRYFKTRSELDLAYVDRSARLLSLRLERDLAGIENARARLVEGILLAVKTVRASPDLSAWFEPQASGRAAHVSQGSLTISELSIAFISGLFEGKHKALASGLEGRWLVRMVVSLLSMPCASDEEERLLVDRFVVPGLADGEGGKGD